jgi:hypothetical protein
MTGAWRVVVCFLQDYWPAICTQYTGLRRPWMHWCVVCVCVHDVWDSEWGMGYYLALHVGLYMALYVA